METLVLLWPLTVFLWIPAGFVAGYLGSQARTADLAWFELSIAAFAVGAGCLWFEHQLEQTLEADPRATWATIVGFMFGGLGLGTLSGFLARALGALGWIIGYAASAGTLLFVIYAFVGSLAL